MKKDTIIWAIAIALAILLIVNRQKVTTVAKKLTRGYRNNNPGNIVLTYKDGDKLYWKGEIDGPDKRFKKFKSMPWGYRAMFVTLNSYIKKGYDTIKEIIYRWAPPSENNSAGYVFNVSKRSGIPSDVKVSFDDPEEIKKIVKEISFIENGIKPNIDEIEEGYKLFTG